MIAIRIADSFAAVGVTLRLDAVAARVAPREDDTVLGAALEEAAARRREELGDEAPSQVPAIAAARRAYKALGKDPARYRPAAEALLRRVKQGKGLYRVNSVVDVNNLVSLETGISIGAYDADYLTPPVVARPGGEGESYEGIGRGALNLAGLPLLADGSGPFGCPTSDSARTAVTPKTRSLLMVLFTFGAPENPSDAVQRAVSLLERHAAAHRVETLTVAASAATP